MLQNFLWMKKCECPEEALPLDVNEECVEIEEAIGPPPNYSHIIWKTIVVSSLFIPISILAFRGRLTELQELTRKRYK